MKTLVEGPEFFEANTHIAGRIAPNLWKHVLTVVVLETERGKHVVSRRIG